MAGQDFLPPAGANPDSRAHEAACVAATRAALAADRRLGAAGTRVLYVEARDSAVWVTVQHGRSRNYGVRSHTVPVAGQDPATVAALAASSLWS